MKRVIPILLLGALALAWTSAAPAKELASFKACGASGCKTVTSPAILKTLIQALELQGEPVSTETPAPAPFFRLEFTAKGDEGMTPSFTQYYVPSVGLIAIRTEPGSLAWIEPGALRSLYRKIPAGLTPYGKPKLTRAAIGGVALADPASYARLFVLHGPTDNFPSDPDWLPITFRSTAPSPWTSSAATLAYSPSKNVLWRGVEYVKLSSRLAANLEHHRSLTAASSGGAAPWLLVFLGVGGAGLLASCLVFARRRKMDRTPAGGAAALPD